MEQSPVQRIELRNEHNALRSAVVEIYRREFRTSDVELSVDVVCVYTGRKDEELLEHSGLSVFEKDQEILL